MSDETTLLSCPFCGSEAFVRIDTSLRLTQSRYRVGCDKDPSCHGWYGHSRYYATEAEAIAAWNTRATHGTLTAEQVREAIEKRFDFDVLVPAARWQAIADELNELGSGTCEPKWTLQGKTQTQEFWRCECGNCGYEFGVEDRQSFPWHVVVGSVDVPNFCPECGVKQKAVGR